MRRSTGIVVPEYTVSVTAASAVTVVLDLWILRTRVLVDRRMPIVGALILFFMLLVDGWLTARPIVVYDDTYRAFPRLGSIPLEDFLYGFALVVLSLICWERAKNARAATAALRRPGTEQRVEKTS